MSEKKFARFVSAFCGDGGTNKKPYCQDCRDAGRNHTVDDKSAGHTNQSSHWGSGVPRTIRVCSGCGAQDGPWVSAELVGGCW